MASGSFFVLFAKPPLALRRTLSLRTQLLAIQTAHESGHTLLKQQALLNSLHSYPRKAQQQAQRMASSPISWPFTTEHIHFSHKVANET